MTKRLAIFTHVEHRHTNGEYFAYAPYIREMRLWFKHVEEVEIVAPVNRNKEMSASEAYRHDKLTFNPVPALDLLNLRNTIRTLFLLPKVFYNTLAAMNRADHLHLRCPGNIGLIASICQVFFPGKSKSAKYAGNWDPKAKQPWSYNLQKWLLSNTFLTRNMTVLVYGDWPGKSVNIKPFFTASFSEIEIDKTKEKSFEGPFTFLFVGNLVPGKQALRAIQMICKLKETGVLSRLEIYGDGTEREKLELYCKGNQLEQLVEFKGNRSLEELKKAYEKAHFVILPSKSEGWPKALAEGMFYGCIPIATPVSCVPWMLGNGSRGILLNGRLLDTFQKSRQFECLPDSPQGEPENISRTGFSETLEVRIRGNKKLSDVGGQVTVDVQKISRLMKDQKEMQRMSEEAKKWSQQYTLEGFEEAIKEILNKSNEKSPLSKVKAGDGNTFSGSL